MENEIMDINMETNADGVEVFDLDEYDATDYCGGKRGLKLAAGLVLVGGAVVGGLAYKFRGKLEERKINKLRKKGYVIFKEDEVEVHEVDVDEDEDVAEEATPNEN